MTLSEKPLPGAECVPSGERGLGLGRLFQSLPLPQGPGKGNPLSSSCLFCKIRSVVSSASQGPSVPVYYVTGVGDTTLSDCSSHCGGTRTGSWVAAVPWCAWRQRVKTWALHERAWTQTCPCASATARGGTGLSEPWTSNLSLTDVDPSGRGGLASARPAPCSSSLPSPPSL